MVTRTRVTSPYYSDSTSANAESEHQYGDTPAVTIPAFRIVAENKGNCTVGYRVQENMNTHEYNTQYWQNRGRRVYTREDARHLRDFLIHQKLASVPMVTYSEVE